MSIDKDMKIATLEAELEMERTRAERYKGLHDLAKGRVNSANEHIDLIIDRNKELKKELNKPQTHHVKPISAERIGEIVADVVRGRG